MPQAKPVVLFLVDGMRPDGLQRADTPTMDHLIATGAHTMSARTVMPSITLPCHASLFLGVMPARHGITTNTWAPPARPVPGIFEVLHDEGYTAACFYNWEQLRDLGRPGTLDASFYVRLKHETDGWRRWPPTGCKTTRPTFALSTLDTPISRGTTWDG